VLRVVVAAACGALRPAAAAGVSSGRTLLLVAECDDLHLLLLLLV
jgi:hypothetical protein